MAQERIFGTGAQRREETELPEPGAPAPSTPAAQAQTGTAGTDDLLAEIDGVLESNAEEFVKGFVQKGGQ
ncbi:ubiquitin-like protein Pup [Kocuria sp. CPCC 205292]|jgi:prokaryotic ubiquitin-like protein Pup|uniref:Prokaryotic ubiquitin-like protein Pup n=1 Tax=Kocuria rosea subsp. polaris TaxID=136273 RepID=A0A0W8I4F1_KOCRO|nr:ubiquitin-like protein Pup [Kocuria polaris]KUG52896.1 ubiquitin [Kocuria polaris]